MNETATKRLIVRKLKAGWKVSDVDAMVAWLREQGYSVLASSVLFSMKQGGWFVGHQHDAKLKNYSLRLKLDIATKMMTFTGRDADAFAAKLENLKEGLTT